MSAGMLGYLTGMVMIGGVLPFAFIAYGRRGRKDWAVTTGAIIAALVLLGGLGGGLNLGHALALVVAGLGFLVKPAKQA